MYCSMNGLHREQFLRALITRRFELCFPALQQERQDGFLICRDSRSEIVICDLQTEFPANPNFPLSKFRILKPKPTEWLASKAHSLLKSFSPVFRRTDSELRSGHRTVRINFQFQRLAPRAQRFRRICWILLQKKKCTQK